MSKPETIKIDEVEYIRKDSVPSCRNYPERDDVPFNIGSSYFFRTVTYHMTGRVVAVVGNFIFLRDAAWIADSGRFMNAIKNGTLSEVEPVGDAIISLGAIVDAFPWIHVLPTTQK